MRSSISDALDLTLDSMIFITLAFYGVMPVIPLIIGQIVSKNVVGRALKRLGFENKRRVGSGVQYYLTREGVEDLAKRLGIEPEPAKQQSENERREGFCEVCGGETNKCYVRGGRLVWLCDRCIADWEGKL
ncbi:MAG: hypothetical protein QXU81_09220 [Candidatus Bathyarchaeia archaeon]